MATTPSPRKKPSNSSTPHTKPLLPVEEWDFGSVNDIDLSACYLFEYWREKCHRDPTIAEALDRLRKEVRADDDAIRRHDQREMEIHRHLVETKAPGITEAHAEGLDLYGR